MPDTANPYREDIAGYLRRAQCHYGAQLLYDEAGWTVEDTANELDVQQQRVRACRRSVHRVIDGQFAANKTQADFDADALRALLHFRGEMSDGLREHINTRLNRLRTEHELDTGVEPLRCKYGFDSSSKSTTPPLRSPTPPEPAAELDEPEPEPVLAPDSASTDEVDELGYASAAERQQVDEMAMEHAMDEATRRWPTAAVTQMPHNNPGFDIEVQHPVEGTRYIEVKGTRSPEPAFFITAGEVEHSLRHPDRYSIWIFHAMDLDSGEATLTEHDGPVTESHFELRPVQYRGRFTGPR
ncbi:DUF3883 domain-containing protein [Mycolicibacter heraklionensis]|uniref:DUF3883 domain-containing protein n=1 Tax=Mycolicibacter heraklionensis TaxID=512402 RepID=A0A9X7WKN6_9MYCO|nr:DUF3883 domain-containing protein [Mycolicibacter heraklionensis]QZA09632.1 DUF3883 domain-containing protein [Mycolicibacter heraklionensis]